MVLDLSKQDVWSLGVTMHELLFGEKPFTEDELYGLITKGGSIPCYRHLDASEDDSLHARGLRLILQRMLDIEPRDRPSAAQALLCVQVLLFGPEDAEELKEILQSAEQCARWIGQERLEHPHLFCSLNYCCHDDHPLEEEEDEGEGKPRRRRDLLTWLHLEFLWRTTPSAIVSSRSFLQSLFLPLSS